MFLCVCKKLLCVRSRILDPKIKHAKTNTIKKIPNNNFIFCTNINKYYSIIITKYLRHK